MSLLKNTANGSTAIAVVASVKQVTERSRQTKAQAIVKYLLDTHSSLEDLQYSVEGLEPGERVNRIFSGLVELCLQIHDKETVVQVCHESPWLMIPKQETNTYTPLLMNRCSQTPSFARIWTR